MTETWLQIAGYEGLYDISDYGRVWSIITQRFLKPMTAKQYHSVGLWANGIRTVHRVHHLVLENFVGPRPPGLEGCHWDDDKSNNRLTNLRWDTQSSNRKDAVRNGRNHNTIKIKCRNGHDYSEENTRIAPSGERRCRICEREQSLAGYYRRKARGRVYAKTQYKGKTYTLGYFDTREAAAEAVKAKRLELVNQ
jgi:hypothetical protein